MKRIRSHSQKSLCDEEKNIIANKTLKFYSKGLLLLRLNVADIVELLVNTLSSKQNSKLDFKQGKPGHKHLKMLIKKHK